MYFLYADIQEDYRCHKLCIRRNLIHTYQAFYSLVGQMIDFAVSHSRYDCNDLFFVWV